MTVHRFDRTAFGALPGASGGATAPVEGAAACRNLPAAPASSGRSLAGYPLRRR